MEDVKELITLIVSLFTRGKVSILVLMEDVKEQYIVYRPIFNFTFV